jgi:hypothetical protein
MYVNKLESVPAVGARCGHGGLRALERRERVVAVA